MNNLDPKLVLYLRNKYGDENEVLLYLLSLRHDLTCRVSEEAFQFLQVNNLIYLDLNTGKIKLSTGLYQGETVSLPEEDFSNIEDIRLRIDEYRTLFKGIRSGSIGVKSKVIELMIEFCTKNAITLDEVIAVTRTFIASSDSKFIPNADNFIEKIDASGNIISPLLLAFEEQSMSDTNYKIL